MTRNTLLLLILIFNSVYCDFTVSIPDERQIRRPCGAVTGLTVSCVRQAFLSKKWCPKIRVGVLPKPLHIEELVTHLAVANVTAVYKKLVVDGLQKGVITDFYVNDETNKSVLTVSYKDVLILGSAEMYLHRFMKEDIVLTTELISEIYPSLLLTTIIATSGKKFTHATMEELPDFSLGLEYANFMSIEMKKFTDAVVGNNGVLVRELFVGRTPIFMDFYIRNIVCNKKYYKN